MGLPFTTIMTNHNCSNRIIITCMARVVLNMDDPALPTTSRLSRMTMTTRARPAEAAPSAASALRTSDSSKHPKICKRFAALANKGQIATVEMQTPLMSDQSRPFVTPCDCRTTYIEIRYTCGNLQQKPINWHDPHSRSLIALFDPAIRDSPCSAGAFRSVIAGAATAGATLSGPAQAEPDMPRAAWSLESFVALS
ncbi:hypothetical protein SVAN01_02618 [Stagonosporopsis vannaccii]|nr:hypothetical protein SVAN01_02618 [Stagonosporopsis vannaccii]